MNGILVYMEDENVSSNVIKNSTSSFFDAQLTNVINCKFSKFFSRYNKKEEKTNPFSRYNFTV